MVSPANDTRMSIALLIRIGEPMSGNIDTYLRKIKEVEPDLYYYQRKDFHITVLDVLGGVPGRTIPDNIDDYIGCIRECAGRINPFYINFNGMTSSDNAALVCGYYEYELEKLRELLRSSFKERGLCLEERYKTFSSHITVTRILNKLSFPHDYVRVLQEAGDFGNMKVTSLELVYHNWYDSKKQVLANIDLAL